jgi:hypothetical protein
MSFRGYPIAILWVLKLTFVSPILTGKILSMLFPTVSLSNFASAIVRPFRRLSTTSGSVTRSAMRYQPHEAVPAKGRLKFPVFKFLRSKGKGRCDPERFKLAAAEVHRRSLDNTTCFHVRTKRFLGLPFKNFQSAVAEIEDSGNVTPLSIRRLDWDDMSGESSVGDGSTAWNYSGRSSCSGSSGGNTVGEGSQFSESPATPKAALSSVGSEVVHAEVVEDRAELPPRFAEITFTPEDLVMRSIDTRRLYGFDNDAPEDRSKVSTIGNSAEPAYSNRSGSGSIVGSADAASVAGERKESVDLSDILQLLEDEGMFAAEDPQPSKSPVEPPAKPEAPSRPVGWHAMRARVVGRQNERVGRTVRVALALDSKAMAPEKPPRKTSSPVVLQGIPKKSNASPLVKSILHFQGNSPECTKFVASKSAELFALFGEHSEMLGQFMRKSGTELHAAKDSCEAEYERMYLKEFESFLDKKDGPNKSSTATLRQAHFYAVDEALHSLGSSTEDDLKNYEKFLRAVFEKPKQP